MDPKKFLYFSILTAIFLLCIAGPVSAETMTYDGTQPLQNAPDPAGTLNSLFLGTPAAPLSSGNTITVDFLVGASPVRVFGGISNTENSISNTVNLLQGIITERIYGGYGGMVGNAEGNTVSISGGSVGGRAVGGHSINGDSRDNSLSISGGNVNDVYGGTTSATGAASGNRVTVNGGQVGDGMGTVANGWVIGGYSNAGTADGNTVVISGSVLNQIEGGESSNGTASNNHVAITGGEVKGAVVRGGYSGSGPVFGNTITIDDGDIAGHVMGGQGLTGEIRNNRVFINGGILSDTVTGGYSTDGLSSSNSVTVTGGTITHFLAGGSSGTGSVSGNSVNISGGTFQGVVFGGHGNTATHIINNTVSISGNPVFDSFVMEIYGGFNTSGGGDVFTGNTLNINGFQGAVRGIYNFQNYNFVLPASISNGDTILTITGPDRVDLAGTKIAITGVETGSPLFVGDMVYLIDKTENAIVSFSGDSINLGIMLQYSFEHAANIADALVIRITSAGTNPQVKAFSEGRLASLAFVNQGADFIANQAISQAVQDTQNGHNLTPFAIMSGSKSRYQSGSHINVEGFSALAGLAWGHDLTPGRLTVGAFFETGWGSYNTHNSFNNAPSVKGDGDTEYYGGGVLGRFDFAGSVLGSFYTEASTRMGSVSNDFSSHDLGMGGPKATYDADSLYYSLHGGLGYIFNITKNIQLDTYGKFFWTHQDGDSVHIFGDRLKFDDADSLRARLGGRLSLELLPGFTPYGGAAYEYEFSGKAKAKTYGYSVLTPEIKGGSGLFEVGGVVQPNLDMGLYFDFAVQGYMGKREGLTGSISLGFSF